MTDTELTEAEEEIIAAAEQFARRGSKEFVRIFTDLEKHPADPNPVSVFMAGSPGAGKTEASIALLKRTDPDGTTVRIDPDELRREFEGYQGDNSWLFQTAVSILVEKIHDKVLKNHQNFLLDGTFANLNKSKENIDRSLRKGRFVQIVYVYQDPKLAWDFVVKREILEGRRILPEHFVAQYFGARKAVNEVKKEFGKDVQVDLLLKNLDNSPKVYKANIDVIDHYVPERYTEEQVLELIAPEADE